jgi:hypothetical protein
VALALGLALAAVLALRSGPDLLARRRAHPAASRGVEAAPAEGAPGVLPTSDPPPSELSSAAPPVTTTSAPASPPPGTTQEGDRAGRGRGEPAAPATTRARLVIRAKPWAELRVDGKRAGYVQGSRTVRLPAGRHLVELTGPDGVSGAYTVQLVQGHTATLEHPPAEH